MTDTVSRQSEENTLTSESRNIRLTVVDSSGEDEIPLFRKNNVPIHTFHVYDYVLVCF